MSMPTQARAGTGARTACTAWRRHAGAAVGAILAIGLAVGSAAAQANAACGLRATHQLAAGDSAGLTRLFKAGDAATLAQLDGLALAAGALTELTVVEAPRFAASEQRRVWWPGAPASFGFSSVRVNAESARLGPVQLHWAIEPGSDCVLLGVYLESSPKPVSGAPASDPKASWASWRHALRATP